MRSSRTTPTYRDSVVIADYDDRWPRLFEELARPLREAVADLGARVEHVGSTSVPGLAAKPIIDIDVAVHAPSDVPVAIERLRALGYVYQGDKGVRGRHAFLWPPGTVRHHVYVVVAAGPAHVDHVIFRDYLRAHPEVAGEYAQLKRRLAARHRGEQLAGQARPSRVLSSRLDWRACTCPPLSRSRAIGATAS